MSKSNAEAAKPKTKAESFNFKGLIEKYANFNCEESHYYDISEKGLEELVDGLESALRARVFVKMEFLISAINREKSKLNCIIK